MSDPFARLVELAAGAEATVEVRPRRRVEDVDAASPWAWTNDAACTDLDTNLFYPDGGETVDARAVATCRRCPVRPECQDWALRHENEGYWAGMTPTARRRLRRSLGLTIADHQDPTTPGDPAA